MKSLLASLIVLFLFVPLLSLGEETENKYPVLQYQLFILPSGMEFVAPAIVYYSLPPKITNRYRFALFASFYSEMHGINYNLLTCIAEKESNFNPQAVGDKGLAKGLFQIHTDKHPISEECAFDTECSMDFTARKIKEGRGYLWTTFKKCNKV